MTRLRFAAAAFAAAISTPAFSLAVIEDLCVSVSDAAGCTFEGNINSSNFTEVQDLYNGLVPAKFDAPIMLSYLASTDDGELAGLGGGITGGARLRGHGACRVIPLISLR